ncbi:hypothetical protein R50071_45220 [Halioxenophilus aromaticivorans]
MYPDIVIAKQPRHWDTGFALFKDCHDLAAMNRDFIISRYFCDYCENLDYFLRDYDPSSFQQRSHTRVTFAKN